jgi:hypothetical protein
MSLPPNAPTPRTGLRTNQRADAPIDLLSENWPYAKQEEDTRLRQPIQQMLAVLGQGWYLLSWLVSIGGLSEENFSRCLGVIREAELAIVLGTRDTGPYATERDRAYANDEGWLRYLAMACGRMSGAFDSTGLSAQHPDFVADLHQVAARVWDLIPRQ